MVSFKVDVDVFDLLKPIVTSQSMFAFDLTRHYLLPYIVQMLLDCFSFVVKELSEGEVVCSLREYANLNCA